MPQFDPFTGKSHECGEYLGPVAQVLFCPISPSLAEKIRKNGDQAEASELPMLSFDLPPGTVLDSREKFSRYGRLRQDRMRICGFCNLEFESDRNDACCPRCLAKIQWYCSKCDALKHNPLVFLKLRRGDDMKIVRIPIALLDYVGQIVRNIPGGWGLDFKDIEVRCPECEPTDPRGLRPVKAIGEFMRERIFTHYVLDVDGHRHIILDNIVLNRDCEEAPR
ncbi:MAG: hypothetical protein A4E48_00288 [Methanosaeta sp. PtaU1.Bin060]|nr:MAG: hypothetical protein A4E48_00288 [Methanosaeta sp. PtaU1.Bin060]